MGVLSSKLTGIVVVFRFAVSQEGGDTERGNAPGISSLSSKAESLTGSVRGVRPGASCDNETRFGVDEFLLRRRAELRLAMAAEDFVNDLGVLVYGRRRRRRSTIGHSRNAKL